MLTQGSYELYEAGNNMFRDNNNKVRITEQFDVTLRICFPGISFLSKPR